MSTEADDLLVADSFRVRANPRSGEAEVRGFDRHLFRFSRSVHQVCGGTHEGISYFLEAAREQIAQFGEGMPRLELLRGNRLHLRLRPLPELRQSIELRAAPDAVLTNPEHKGPNIALLSRLNQELGAEALLLDADGHVTEGATTSFVWWRGPTLHRAQSGARVPSVTESLLANIAKSNDIMVAREAIEPSALVSCEVWALNALHGIRPVTSIDGNPLPPADSARLAAFRAVLDKSWQRVRK